METVATFWIAHGHMSLDVLIATYYEQARTQLKIIRNNLENLCGDRTSEADVRIGLNKQFVDELDGNVSKRFVRCVKRYEKVVWFV